MTLLEKINSQKDLFIGNKVMGAFPSIFSATDVVTLITKYHDSIIQAIETEEPTDVSNLTDHQKTIFVEDLFMRIIEGKASNFERSVFNSQTDLVSHFCFNISYDNKIEVEDFSIDTETFLDILINASDSNHTSPIEIYDQVLKGVINNG